MISSELLETAEHNDFEKAVSYSSVLFLPLLKVTTITRSDQKYWTLHLLFVIHVIQFWSENVNLTGDNLSLSTRLRSKYPKAVMDIFKSVFVNYYNYRGTKLCPWPMEALERVTT
jgi:hypothetical protein